MSAANLRGDEKPGRWNSDLPTRAVPLDLATRYRNVRQPALKNMRYSVAVQEFVQTSIIAFECGHSQESLRGMLPAPGSEDSPFAGEEDADIFYDMIAVPWLTLSMIPKSTVKRWSEMPAVSDDSVKQWKGFVEMIVTAYYEKRWAWYPLEPLQMEVMASGRKHAPKLDVAEMARLVYRTLECTAPQF